MRNLQLCIFYDGNGTKACVLDFGHEPSWGPYGNQGAIEQALAPKYGDDCSVTALVDWSDKGDLSDADLADAANQVTLDDEQVDTLEVVKVEPR